jgi:translation initiation factor IF-1
MFRSKKLSTNASLKNQRRKKSIETSEKDIVTIKLSDVTEKELIILKEAENEI